MDLDKFSAVRTIFNLEPILRNILDRDQLGVIHGGFVAMETLRNTK